MRIEISIYKEDTEAYEHEGYYDTFGDAIDALYKLQNIEIKKRTNAYKYPCFKCVYEYFCGEHPDDSGKCKKYKRDPPDGGYYG